MIEFFILLAIVAVCVLLFGKADQKRDMLRSVGLDISPSTYEAKKKTEFQKYCCKAMIETIEKYNINSSNESAFLQELQNILYMWSFGEVQYHIDVAPRFCLHAAHVIDRRREALKKEGCQPLLFSCNFSDKDNLKKYVRRLWEEYQYPWPDDWLKAD